MEDLKPKEMTQKTMAELVGSFNKAQRVAYRAGLLAASQEVATHWNDSHMAVNQRAQALRSASVLLRKAEEVVL